MKLRRERYCLKCEISFISAGPENRVCDECRFVNTFQEFHREDTETCVGCELKFEPSMIQEYAGYRLCVHCIADMEKHLYKGVGNV